MEKQIEVSGLRLGDSCSIFPFQGMKKAFTLNRNCIDLISSKYRPENLCMSYIELPKNAKDHFHYRLEIDHSNNTDRFILKTLKGNAYWLNGTATKEAFIERMDRLFIDDNKINFDPFNLTEAQNFHFEHPILKNQLLMSSDLKILIQGETGTGKSHLASKIHEMSGRSGRFISINLSSYNPQLIESELFGHKRGSFTGAISDKKGAFHEAENGTLFLDEIDSLPIDIQTKLLTFLDNNSFRKVGEIKEISIKARLIFASGSQLEQLVQKEKFRKDFYFRLKSGHTIELLPLRNDLQKIKEACQNFSIKNGISLSERLKEFYQTLAWPGNLRQLYGHLNKKKVLSKSLKLDFDQLDEELLLQSSNITSFESFAGPASLQQVKEEYVRKVFYECDGSFIMASKKLRITEKTIRSIIGKNLIGQNESNLNL